MKQSNYSIHTHWDKRYPRKGTDKCPVQLSISINGLQFKVGLKLYASKDEFEKAMSCKSGTKEVKELRTEITNYTTKAEAILERLQNPTRESFQRLFKSETDLFNSNKTDVTFLFEEYMDNLKAEDRIKTAENMLQSLKSFKRFRSTLYFEDIDEAFLKGYRNWMEKNGNSATTAQIYMRSSQGSNYNAGGGMNRDNLSAFNHRLCNKYKRAREWQLIKRYSMRSLL